MNHCREFAGLRSGEPGCERSRATALPTVPAPGASILGMERIAYLSVGAIALSTGIGRRTWVGRFASMNTVLVATRLS